MSKKLQEKDQEMMTSDVEYLIQKGFSLTSVLRSRETSCVSTAVSCAMHSAA
ncbi:hypothetical protein F2Q69_00054021 [Brassica cretica]|uniref:Uncharacterized protein n=1 Tax=Brassica cretica TaxID=69181 RepID=A0A8S9MTF5_BRACR|nr:hypothetical protein F2Q69_00054021 [Brassica cretica]